jgi:uncharacterized protein (TIGR03382 family)
MLRDPKRSHPFFWAAFIVAGNWTPLELPPIATPVGVKPVSRGPRAACGCSSAAETTELDQAISLAFVGVLALIALRRRRLLAKRP